MGEVSPLERDHSLRVVLPAGIEKNITVHGSKPVMDLLVTLCANHHLNPSDYTIEFLSPNKNIISYKPNSPIGLLGAEKILLKLKGSEDKIKKPYMPEATVRLLINYNKSHKTVVRVNPRLPLEALLPAVCDKCEFNIKTTVLLRDPQSKEPLDLTKTLNDHGLREVFAKDMVARNASAEGRMSAGTPEIISPPPTQDLQRKGNKQKKRGFFSFFRRRKKINETNGTLSAPASPSRGKQVRVRGNSESLSSNNTLPADTAKKRPAPPPPVGASQSVPNNLSTCYVKRTQSSAESTLRSTKRRAPPPPCGATNDAQSDAGESLKTVEELRETDNSQPNSSLASSSPSLARLQEIPDSYRPSFRGKDLSDARSALAKVLTSSVSKGTLVRRLRNSAGFPNFHVSSCMSAASKCPDDGDFCAERESVFRSNLPTENEWEDQVQRSGLTTFKVIPPKKPASCDPEMMDQESVLPEGKEDPHSSSRFESRTGINCSETYANEVVDGSISGSPLEETHNSSDSPLLDDGETHEDQNQEEEPEVPLEGALPALLGGCDKEASNHDGGNSEHLSECDPSPDMVPLSSSTDGKSQEDFSREEAGGEEAAFPSPPPPVEFSENMGTGEEEASFPSCGTAAPSMNGHRNASGEADDSGSSSAATEPPAGQTKVAPSRFAQAVAMAVQRSRLQRLSLGIGFGPQLSGRPNVSVPSPPRSSYQYGA